MTLALPLPQALTDWLTACIMSNAIFRCGQFDNDSRQPRAIFSDVHFAKRNVEHDASTFDFFLFALSLLINSTIKWFLPAIRRSSPRHWAPKNRLPARRKTLCLMEELPWWQAGSYRRLAKEKFSDTYFHNNNLLKIIERKDVLRCFVCVYVLWIWKGIKRVRHSIKLVIEALSTWAMYCVCGIWKVWGCQKVYSAIDIIGYVAEFARLGCWSTCEMDLDQIWRPHNVQRARMLSIVKRGEFSIFVLVLTMLNLSINVQIGIREKAHYDLIRFCFSYLKVNTQFCIYILE